MAERFLNTIPGHSSEAPRSSEANSAEAGNIGTSEHERGDIEIQEDTATGAIFEDQQEGIGREELVREMRARHADPAHSPDTTTIGGAAKTSRETSSHKEVHHSTGGGALGTAFAFFGLMWSWFADMVKKSSGAKGGGNNGGHGKKDDHGGGHH